MTQCNGHWLSFRRHLLDWVTCTYLCQPDKLTQSQRMICVKGLNSGSVTWIRRSLMRTLIRAQSYFHWSRGTKLLFPFSCFLVLFSSFQFLCESQWSCRTCGWWMRLKSLWINITRGGGGDSGWVAGKDKFIVLNETTILICTVAEI